MEEVEDGVGEWVGECEEVEIEKREGREFDEGRKCGDCRDGGSGGGGG